MKAFYFFFLVVFFTAHVSGQHKSRWKINSDNSIVWKIDHDIPHFDHIEMSGKKVSVVLRYGVKSDGSFTINKSMVWPSLRTIPNDTYGSLMRRYDWDLLSHITVDGHSFLAGERVEELVLNGMLTVKSEINRGHKQWKVTRCYFPSTEQPALIELYQITNSGTVNLSLEIPQCGFITHTNPEKGVKGSYVIEGKVYNDGYFNLRPGESVQVSASISANLPDVSAMCYDAVAEKLRRQTLVESWVGNLSLETPDSIINNMFAFSKIRACESIYATAGGPMHGPGGEAYYAAIWANDQAEYVNPYFPYTGYEYGNLSAFNAFLHFARFINKEWRPLPSSIIAEGTDIWNGAGDRGDAAMIAYGATRYLLARGCFQEAKELWPLICWCLEYCRLNLNQDGVVTSDTDELENRFPAGSANLCTSSLYYDALLSASYLAKALDLADSTATVYYNQACKLRNNIEAYFGAEVEGFHTYAYYQGNDILRSWICIPLTVGISERSQGTVQALFSSRLWTDNGLLTQAGSETFWDRSTLYALRGAYAVGETEKATRYLHHYSANRLLGEHVPYAIEAWPEGEQRHLSAESGLYGRIITEGLFGIRPTGFHTFTLTPRLPQTWQSMSLNHIRAFDTDFDLTIERINDKKIKVILVHKGRRTIYKLHKGSSIKIRLK